MLHTKKKRPIVDNVVLTIAIKGSEQPNTLDNKKTSKVVKINDTPDEYDDNKLYALPSQFNFNLVKLYSFGPSPIIQNIFWFLLLVVLGAKKKTIT